jgi:hypothetical protein
MKQIKTWFYTILLCIIGIVFSQNLSAQLPNAVQNWTCGLDPAYMNSRGSDTGFVNTIARYNYLMNNPPGGVAPAASGPFIVPVVFHIMTSGTVQPTYSQIQWQMAALNAAFSNSITAFNGQPTGSRAVNTQIQFRLACIAQNSVNAWTNAAEPGVMRYPNTNTVVLNQGVAPSPLTTVPMLAITHPTAFPTTFPFANYLNIWCVPNIVGTGAGTVIGYGTFPNTAAISGIDGIVMRLDAIGNNSFPTSFPLMTQLDKGNILAHEVGHYLGLFHTFETAPTFTLPLGCYGTSTLNATTDGDLILDTPPTNIASDLGSITSINSCNETNFPYGGTTVPDQSDQLNNFMCYSDDDKMNTFTQGQANRMVSTFTMATSSRFNLNSVANLGAAGTGIFPVNSCIANSALLTAMFNYSIVPTATCSTYNVQFTNPTGAGITTAGTTYSWTYGDGGTGAGINPVHTYTTSGSSTFTVTLAVTNGTATQTFSQTVSISIGQARIVNQSAIGLTVCRGAEQTIYVRFNNNVPSAQITDGTTIYTVHNNYYPWVVPTPSATQDVPFTLPITSVGIHTFSMYPAVCGGVNLGSATFSVIECCNNLVTNGDMEAGNTGFYSEHCMPPWNSTASNGSAAVNTNALVYGSGPVNFPLSGKIMMVDGCSHLANASCPITTNTVANICVNTGVQKIFFGQTLSGLKPNTNYFISFKSTQHISAAFSYCANLNLGLRLSNGTSTLVVQNNIVSPIVNDIAGTLNNQTLYWYVQNFNLLTPATVSTTTTFSLELYQMDNFGGNGYDYAIDNIIIQEMTSGIQAIGTASICPTQSTSLSVSANCGNVLSNYNYAWTPTSGLSCSTCTNPIASPSATTIYTLVATPTSTAFGSTALVSSVQITVHPLPTLTVTASPTLICAGQSSTLTASGANTYSWSTSASTATTVVTPTVTTTYTVSGRNSMTGCSNTKTVTVLVIPYAPVVSVVSSTVNVCSGNSTTLTASGAATYTWLPGATTGSLAIVTPSALTVYTVSGNYSLAGCGTGTATIMVNPVISTLCCSAANSSISTSTITAGTYAVSGTVIDVSGVITFTGNTSFNGYTFRMAPNAQLRVIYERTLTLTNCKLFGCSELWDGIYLIASNNDIHGHLNLNNTTVEDMYNGIVVEGNGHAVATPTTGLLISSTASKLNKNYISIQFRNLDGMFYTPTSTYTSTPYPFAMVTTTLSSNASTTSPGSTLKPSSTYTYAYKTWPGGATSGANAPFLNFPRTFTGIALNNMRSSSPLIIGDSVTTANTNTFDNMDFGITGTEVTIKVHNNYFKNITGSVKQFLATEGAPPASGPDEIGIAIAMTHTTTFTHSLTVGTRTTVPSSGSPYPKGNVFEDCNKGISALSCKNVYIKANQFNATTTSTLVAPVNTYYYYQNQQAIWVSALSDDATISYNYVRNFANGIYSGHTFSLTTPRPSISQNDIAAPSATGYCKQAIQVSQIGGANISSGSYNILTNRIENVYNGIAAYGVLSGLNICLNDVKIESTAKFVGSTATTTRTAISLSTCSYGNVRGNTVSSNVSPVPTTSTTAGYLTGIRINGCPNSNVECNYTHTIGRDFVFQGSCSNSSWKVNRMENSYRGLEMFLNAVISQQGGPSGSPNLSANTWTTITQETFVQAVSGVNNVNTASRFYLLSGGSPKTQPTLNFAVTAGQEFQTGALLGINPLSSGTSFTCNAGTAQRVAYDSNSNTNANGNYNNNNNNNKVGNVTDSLTEYTNLATADENTYEVFADEFKYINKQLVYKLVKQDSINPAAGTMLDNFYNSNQNTAIDKLTEAQIAIANNDLSVANSANNSAFVSNTVEQKHQRANELTLKYMNDRHYSFTSSERTDLFTMASECVIKGYYVVQARNLVDIISSQAIIYDDNCELEVNNSRKAKTIISSSNSFFNLFPNPNNGIMQLDYDLGNNSDATMKLYDVTGKLVSTYNLINPKGSIQMNEQSIHNGVYFYHILAGEKLLKAEKIVIIK